MSNLGENIKKFGFGFMRLPKIGEEFDIEQTKQMVDCFMEAGFTYFDTAWAYTGSEDVLRQALVERYPRESFQLATKCSAWLRCESREDAIAQFETSLKQTGAGYFDFYLLHNLGGNRTNFYEDYDLWTWGMSLKEKGLIKHLGFSMHGTPEELEEVLKAHPEAEFVQLQINYADWENPAIKARECYELARKYDKPVIVMEPVKGGMLANPPQAVKDVFAAADPDASAASWGVKFAADLEGVMVVLSGMSTLEQTQDNVSYMKDFTGLSASEKETIEKARKVMEEQPLVPCTSCNYCSKVCPMDIGISGTFQAANYLTIYNDKTYAQNQRRWMVESQGKVNATECIKCGACEEACPQHISIREELEKAAAALA